MDPTPTECPASGRRSRLRHGLTLLTAAVLCLTTIEFISRQMFCGLFKIHDPNLGRLVLSPGAIRAAKEGSGLSHWGPHGVREPASSQRGGILCMGDSFTESLQVDDDEVFTRQLAIGLARECSSELSPIDVLNIGFSGLAIADHIGLAPRYREFFDPAWVIVEVGDNDFLLSENTRSANYSIECGEDGAVQIHPPKTRPGSDPRLEQIGRRLAFLPFCYARVREIVAGAQRSAETPMFWAATESGLKKPPEPPTVPIKSVLKELAEAYEGRLTVLYLADFDLAHPEKRTSTEQTVVDSLRSMGVSVVTTSTLNAELSRLHRSIYGFSNGKFGEGHLNAYGHSRVGRLLCNELNAQPKLATRLKSRPSVASLESDEATTR